MPTLVGMAVLACGLSACSNGLTPASGPSTTVAASNAPAPATTAASGSSTTGSAKPAQLQRERRDLAYVDDGVATHRLDLFLPSQGDGPFPVLVWVHGGAWRMGDKNQLDGELQTDQFKRALLDHGIAIASINYGLVPNSRFPAPLHDVVGAVRYLRAQAPSLGVDPERFAIGGESAGGHLAALAGYTSGEPTLQGTLGGTTSSSVKAVLGFYGLYDLRTREADALAAGCGGHERTGADSSHGKFIGADPGSPDGSVLAAQASPITHVTKSSPATLLLHGRRDCNAPYLQAEKLSSALRAAGAPVELKLIDAGHAEATFYTNTELRQTMLAFLDRYLTKG